MPFSVYKKDDRGRWVKASLSTYVQQANSRNGGKWKVVDALGNDVSDGDSALGLAHIASHVAEKEERRCNWMIALYLVALIALVSTAILMSVPD